MKTITKLGLAAVLALSTTISAHALTIDFGTKWPAQGNPLPDQVIYVGAGQHATEADVAALLNTATGGSFTAGDINKTDNEEPTVIPQINNDADGNGQFAIGSGWKYLIVQYDGKNAGSFVIQLDGAAALVPYAS